jgi:hypothetical protein
LNRDEGFISTRQQQQSGGNQAAATCVLLRVEISDSEQVQLPWQHQAVDGTVVAVDYDTYALVYTCEKQYLGLWTKESVVLLTRQTIYDRELLITKVAVAMLKQMSSQIYTVLPTVINEPGYCNVGKKKIFSLFY